VWALLQILVQPLQRLVGKHAVSVTGVRVLHRAPARC
jgi:hypothetical protein